MADESCGSTSPTGSDTTDADDPTDEGCGSGSTSSSTSSSSSSSSSSSGGDDGWDTPDDDASDSCDCGSATTGSSSSSSSGESDSDSDSDSDENGAAPTSLRPGGKSLHGSKSAGGVRVRRASSPVSRYALLLVALVLPLRRRARGEPL